MPANRELSLALMNRQETGISTAKIKPRKGFTLVELMTVVSVLALLATVVVPAIDHLLASSQRTRAMNEIASLIALARSEAMTRQRYTWLGFTNTVDASGVEQLEAVVLCTPGGSISTTSIGSVVYITSARPITPTSRWKNLRLEPRASLDKLQSLLVNQQASISVASLADQGFRLGGSTAPRLQLKTITFTPQGYALLNPRPTIMTPYTRSIDIGLKPFRIGANDQIAVILDGFSGRTNFVRQ